MAKQEFAHFEGANTVKELLVAPKVKDNIIQKRGRHLQVQMQSTQLQYGIHRGKQA